MRNLFLLAIIAVLLSGCKKDLDNAPPKTELLTTSKWRVSAYTSKVTLSNVATIGAASPASVTTTDRYASMAACEKDNFLKYNINKTMVQDEGPTKCYTYLVQQKNYTWDFNSDQTKIFVNDANGWSAPFPSTIVELSTTTLRLRDTYSYTSGNVTSTTVDEITYTAF